MAGAGAADHRRSTGHELLDRPRDIPWRTAIGAALFTFITLIFLAGSADRIFVSFGIDYETQVWIFRAAVFVLPAIVYLLTKRICEELRDSNWHPLREPPVVVSRTRSGGFGEPGAGAGRAPRARAVGRRAAERRGGFGNGLLRLDRVRPAQRRAASRAS